MQAKQREAVLKIARIYEVGAIFMRTNLDYFASLLQDDVIEGPNGDAALSLSRRIVYIAPSCAVEFAIHEIVHLVVQPTGIDIAEYPEEFVLLQFERAMVRALARDCLKAVLRYQDGTMVRLLAEEDGRQEDGYAFLEEFPDYETDSAVWNRGYRNAIDLGLLDERHRPTKRTAIWTPALHRRALRASRKAFG